MRYVSIREMNDLIKNNLNKLPNDIDLVVGNPRSGMLPALIIGLSRNLPVTDIDSFVNNKIYSCGVTKRVNILKEYKKVLIVEDSSYSGNSIKNIESKIPSEIKNKCILLVIYSNELTKSMSDIYFEIINESRIFEWNLFHHKYLNYCGLDFNILYKEEKLRFIPTQKIGAIIINEHLNKMEIKNKLLNDKIEFNRIIYPDELDSSIKFIITSDIDKYKLYNIPIIDYDNGLYYARDHFE